MGEIVWKIKKFEELSASELYEILRVRTEVFIIEQHCNYQDEDNYDQKAIHLFAENNGEILAYCRLFHKGIKYPEASIGRVLTTQKARGKNLGKLLIKYAIETIENRFRTSEIRISAQDYLLKFYGDFGFQDTGKKYLEDEIPHTEMVRN